MNMKRYILTVMAAAAIVVQACNGNSGRNVADTDTGQLGAADTSISGVASMGTDTTFANKAAVGGLAEVEFGKLAISKTSNSSVKHFAEMMVEDHGKANAELEQIAASKNIMLPAELDQEHKSKYDQLSTLSGKEFDKQYVEEMIDGHKKTLELMNSEAQNGADAELKAFAAKTAPVVDGHLQMIQKIHDAQK